MAETADLPDYATMQRSIERLHEADGLVGIRCPRADCEGIPRREDGAFVCDDCGRSVRLR